VHAVDEYILRVLADRWAAPVRTPSLLDVSRHGEPSSPGASAATALPPRSLVPRGDRPADRARPVCDLQHTSGRGRPACSFLQANFLA
jgi:hypothetical protein